MRHEAARSMRAEAREANRQTDLAHPVREATLTSHTDAVTAVALSADGHTALTGSWDHTAIVWNLSVLDQLLNPSGAVCMAAGGGLDPTTWNRYIPATIATFRETC